MSSQCKRNFHDFAFKRFEHINVYNGNDKYEIKSKMKGLRFECWFMNME